MTSSSRVAAHSVGLVGRYDNRGLFVEGVYEIEEPGGILFLYREEHYVVDCDKVCPQQLVVGGHRRRCQFLHLDYSHDVFHCHHVGSQSVAYGLVDESRSNEGLACAGRLPHQDKVICLREPVEFPEFVKT